MRPILLKIKGLNSFIEEQTIDFARLMEPGLFGIFGPTGSGKTTILDGITLALYGEIARKSKNFINTNSKSASILYEFQISGAETKRYRVEREFKKDANKEGYKTGKCRLSDITGDTPIVLADKVKEVNNCCIDIIGLKSDDFQRTVVLPQGKFSEFLKLDGKNRNEMLERLFRLQPYGDGLNRKLKEKSDEISLNLTNLEGQLKTYEDITEDKLKEKKEEIESLTEQFKEKKKSFLECCKIYDNGKEIWNLQIEKEQHTKKKVQLDDRKKEIEQLELEMALSQKANKIYPYIESLNLALKEEEEKQSELVHLKEKRDLSEQNKNVIEQEFLKSKEAREVELPVLRDKIQSYKEAIGYQNEYEQLSQQNQSYQKKLKDRESKYKKSQSDEAELKKIIDENSEKIEKLQESQKKYEITAEVRQQIQVGAGLEQQASMLAERIEKAEQDYRKLEDEKSQKEVYLKKLTEVLFPQGAREPSSIADYQNALYELREKKKLYAEYVANKESKIQELNSCKQELNRITKQKEEKEQTYLEQKRQKETLEVEMLSYQLRQTLQEGAPCPVCGSIHYEKVQLHEIDSEQFEKVKSEFNDLENQIRNLEKKEFGLTESQNRIQSEVQEFENKITEVKLEADKLTEEEIERRLKALPDYQPAKIALEMVNRSIGEKAESLQRDKEEYGKCQQQLAELLKKVSYQSFAIAAEKLHKCDEMLEKIKTSLERGGNITEQKRKDYEECKNKQNDLKTEIAICLENIRNVDERIKNLKIKFINSVSQYDSIRIEDTCLRERLQVCLEREKQMEEQYRDTEERKEKETENYLKLQGKYLELNAAFELLKKRIEQDTKKVEAMLKEEKFDSIQSCVNARMTESSQQEKQASIDHYRTEYAENKGILSKIEEQLSGRTIAQDEWLALERKRQEEENEFEELKLTLGNQKHSYDRMLADWEKLKDLLLKRKEIEHQASLMADLIQLFRGKKFVEYVAYSKLKYISKAASHRLHDISNGTYGLELDSAGKFMVCDYKNGGVKRDAFTLSGGETFLVSLSLSLALSEQVQLKGTAPLELFFLDEGFGTLDDELLDVVMSSLERIQNKRLTVGIISHVEAVKNRVPIKLVVSPSVSGLGGTKIHIEKN